MQTYGASKQGKRDYQQDEFLIDLDNNIFGVADGMGGHSNGDLASKDVIDSFIELVLDCNEDLSTIFYEADKRCKARCDYSGSTATFAVIIDNTIHIAHSGDSRCYVVAGTDCQQISDDHTSCWGGLTNAIGLLTWVDFYEIKDPPEGLVLILCTDGVSGVLNEKAIFQIVSNSSNPARDLVQAALDADSSDNCTAVVVKL